MVVGVSHQHTDHGGNPYQKEVHGNVQDLRINLFVVQDAAAQTHLKDGGRVEGLANLHPDSLEQHQRAVHLKAAGGRACAAAHQRHQHQHEAGQHGPVGIIGNGKTGSGSIAHHLESTVQEGLSPGHIGRIQLKGKRRHHRDNGKGRHVEAEDGVSKRPEATADNHHEDNAEVHGPQKHEDNGEDRDGRGVKRGDAEVAGRETAGRTDGKGVADGIEPVHARQQITDKSQGAETQEHGSEDGDGLVGPAAVIVPGEGGKLHIGEPKADGRSIGDDKKQENHNSQTADKVRGSPPEDEASGQGLYIFQDGGTRSGEAGNTLEPGVDHREGTAPQRIRKGAENKGQQPGQEDDHEAVLQRDIGVLAGEDKGENAHDEGDGETDQQRREGAVSPVYEGHNDRQEHEEGTHQECHAHITGDDFQVHFSYSL